MNVLVTGGAGYIGSHTVLKLLESGYAVTVIDNLSNSTIESITRVEMLSNNKVCFYECDVNDNVSIDRIIKENNISSIIHFAGKKSVNESVKKPIDYYQNNVIGTLNLTQIAISNNVKNFIFSSSATVYGVPEKTPLSENCKTGNTTNPYGSSKFISEVMLKDISFANEKLNIVSLRYFNPTGAHKSGLIGEDPIGPPNNLVPYLSQVAIGKLEKLTIFGNDYPTNDGTGIRDYIHVEDLAEGHLAALKFMENKNNTTNYHVFNLGTGIGYSVLELINSFEKQSGKSVNYIISKRRPGDVAECWSDPTYANKTLNWVASRSLDEMMEDTWRWQKNNPNGYN